MAAVVGCGGGGGDATMLADAGGPMGTGGVGAGTGGRAGSGGSAASGGEAGGAQIEMGGAGRTGSAGQPGTGGAAASAGQPGTGGNEARGGMAGQLDGGGLAGSGSGGTPGPQDGGASDGSSEGGTAFTPCPPRGSPCVVMPLGDSITDGFTPLAGGYRIELFHQMLLNNKAITFVGTLANGPAMVDAQPFPRRHEGHNGFTIDDAPVFGRLGISPLVDQSIRTYRPHIILLMIGTNDIDLNNNVATAPMRLGALMDRIVVDSPDALLAVATIVPTRTDAENLRFTAYDAAIPAVVRQRAAAGKHVVLVDNHAAFLANPNYKTAWLADNLHPTPAGYAVLGQMWYAAIGSFVPTAP
jgi:lysophospholipase L1-like esterase